MSQIVPLDVSARQATPSVVGSVINRDSHHGVASAARRTDRGPLPQRILSLGLPWFSALLLFTLYTIVAISQHRLMMTSGYDLGIFEQEVRSWAAGHLPTSDLLGPHYPRLGDHFSPATAVLAPIYLLFPSALTLLVAQAALIAVAVVPIARWAQDTLGAAASVVIALCFGMSWGVAAAIGFDFHEVALATPLIAWSTVSIGRRRLVAAAVWAAPLILVKEDLGLTVAVIGLLIAHRGGRRLGLATAVFGLLATVVEMAVIIPAFNPTGLNTQASNDLRLSPELLTTVTGMLTPDTKLLTLALLLAPTAFLAARSPLLWLLVPTLAWRFAGANPAYWGTHYHYSLVLMPVIFAAMIDVLITYPRAARVRALAASLLIGLALLPQQSYLTWWQTRQDPAQVQRAQDVTALLSTIPSNSTVSASNWLAPQLTNRTDVSLFGKTSLDVSLADYVVVDTTPQMLFPISMDATAALLTDAQTHGYRQVESVDGVVLLHRTR